MRIPPKQFSIYVTEEDIKNGTPLKPKTCAVTLSLKRAFDGFISTGVNETIVFGIEYSHNGGEFVCSFDNGKNPSPTIIHFWRR